MVRKAAQKFKSLLLVLNISLFCPRLVKSKLKENLKNRNQHSLNFGTKREFRRKKADVN